MSGTCLLPSALAVLVGNAVKRICAPGPYAGRQGLAIQTGGAGLETARMLCPPRASASWAAESSRVRTSRVLGIEPTG